MEYEHEHEHEHEPVISKKLLDQDHQDPHDDTSSPERRTRSSSTTELADKSSADPYAYMIPKLKSLVLWERPLYSAAALGGALGMLIAWRFFSVFNVFCALGCITIGVNLIYVNGLMQFQKFFNNVPKNPNERFFKSDTFSISHSEVQRRLNQFTDGLNVVIQELIKVVLVEDTARSFKYLVILYVVWTLGNWMSMATLLTLSTISLFAFPRLYLDNQALVDEKLAQGNKLFQEKVAVGKNLAGKQLNTVYVKAQELAASKGLMKPTIKEDKKTE